MRRVVTRGWHLEWFDAIQAWVPVQDFILVDSTETL